MNILGISGSIKSRKTVIAVEADAFIIGTPVYQSSIPGALKNLFHLLPKDAFTDSEFEF